MLVLTIISVLEKWQQEGDHEFKAILVYIGSLRAARTTCHQNLRQTSKQTTWKCMFRCAWWLLLIISLFWRLRLEDNWEFQAVLSHLVSFRSTVTKE